MFNKDGVFIDNNNRTISKEDLLDIFEKRKQNLKDQGIEKLKPIEAFYEIKVGNILEKLYGKNNVKTITDEYGNQWREITIDSNRDLKNIELQLESKGVPNEQLENKIKDWLGKVGIQYNSVEKIYRVDGTEIDAVAKANVLTGILEVVEGKRGIDTLPEEAGHFIVELLGDEHPLVKVMMSKVINYQVYKDVLNSPYAEEYNGDETKLRKEAVGKLIAQVMAGLS